MRIDHLPTPDLETRRAAAEAAGNWDLAERCDAELERRDYDASDPAATADREDREDRGLDPPWFAAEIDGYDRNGAVDAAGHVWSDADPGL